MLRTDIGIYKMDLLQYERQLWQQGIRLIAGVDEAGRGPLAGPVVAAAVVFEPGTFIPGVRDSKKLSPQKRAEFYEIIQQQAISVGIGKVDHEEIDRLNILQAAYKAMRMAVANLKISPEYVLVDGPSAPNFHLPALAIVDGDSLSFSIAAASIIAKVTRDRLMEKLDCMYPQYKFAKNKGYGTMEHIAALKVYGPCPIHRRSFRWNKKSD